MAQTEIGSILEQTLETVRSLEQALRAESEALIASIRAPAAIDDIAQRKQELVAEINALVKSCDRQLTGHGFALGHVGVENWLTSLPPDDPAHAIWQSILDVSVHCKEMNETNGIQIGLLKRRAQDALSVLLGTLGGDETYGRDGTGRSSSQSSRSSYTA